MKRNSLWKISVTTTPKAEDAVAEMLSAIFGRLASAYTDSDTEVSTVTVYLLQKPNLSRAGYEVVSTRLKQIKRCGLRIGSGKIVIARIRREDWAESWKRHFKPIEISQGRARHSVRAAKTARRGLRALPQSLLIKPSWSKRRVRKGQAVIVLDPGLSFGTGQHPTTAFCLNEIVRFHGNQNRRSHRSDGSGRRPCLQPPSFLDLGTGSGILAIAAAKLGYSPVHAMDFDPEAIRVARANARANRVLQRVKIRRRDVSELPIRPRQRRQQRYDLVCANLISDLLIAQRHRIAAQLAPDGTLVLAGILRSEFGAVKKAYKTVGLRLVFCRMEKEWSSGSFYFVG